MTRLPSSSPCRAENSIEARSIRLEALSDESRVQVYRRTPLPGPPTGRDGGSVALQVGSSLGPRIAHLFEKLQGRLPVTCVVFFFTMARSCDLVFLCTIIEIGIVEDIMLRQQSSEVTILVLLLYQIHHVHQQQQQTDRHSVVFRINEKEKRR